MKKSKMPLLSIHSAEHIDRLLSYTPQMLPENSKCYEIPSRPFIKCSFGASTAIDVQTFQSEPWDIPVIGNLDKNYIPVLDTHCKGYTVLEDFPYNMTSKKDEKNGIEYSPYKPKDKEVEPDKDDKKFKYGLGIRFGNFLRIYQHGDTFQLVGLEKVDQIYRVLYHVELQSDCQKFLMSCLDFEKRIIIWTKDKSRMAMEDQETGEVISEVIILQFTTTTVYKVVSSILKCRFPSHYQEFFIDFIVNDSSFKVEVKSQKRMMGTMEKPPIEKKITTGIVKDESYQGAVYSNLTLYLADLDGITAQNV